MDLVRPLGLAGIHCAVVAPAGAAVTFSRFTKTVLEWDGDWADGEKLTERLVRYGEAQPAPPILFYQHDEHLLFISRYRDRLASALRFVIAEESQLVDLMDKVQFAALAQRLGLPVPATTILSPATTPATAADDLLYPLILKPPTRGAGRWRSVDPEGKAVRVDEAAQLRALWTRLAALGGQVLAQELVPGPESEIESYHVYVDADGQIAGEFTGKKIRTRPREYGYTTALVITDAGDVAALGRAVLRRLGLSGVAKVDFKRTPDGQLRLLEINPRFNLWHHPGALAGVNLPALVWSDLAGQRRPPTGPVRPGVRWCTISDIAAARESGMPLGRWLAWALRCEARANLAWDDPIPIVRRALWRVRHRRRGAPDVAASTGADVSRR